MLIYEGYVIFRVENRHKQYIMNDNGNLVSADITQAKLFKESELMGVIGNCHSHNPDSGIYRYDPLYKAILEYEDVYE